MALITYQDFLKTSNLKDFFLESIRKHKMSEAYKVATDAEKYMKRRNPTIANYQKILYSAEGVPYRDIYSPNYKLSSGFFPRLISQEVQYLLAHGMSLDDENDKQKLGAKFDLTLRKLATSALVQGVSYGFWAYDRLEILKLTEFIPFVDEKDGSIKAGLRFWQLSSSKPLRVTLFEMDGITDYIIEDGYLSLYEKKRAYIKKTIKHAETTIYKGENYKSFPIIPLYGNYSKQSELIGIREQIDAYDLIKSGFANDIDSEQVYWILKNVGGMNTSDLQKFRDRLKTVKAAITDDETEISSHTVEIPYKARETYLQILKEGIIEDFQGLDTTKLQTGNRTATEIEASYEAINAKVSSLEENIKEFLLELFDIVGITATPTFTRSMLLNKKEEISNIMALRGLVDDEILISKLSILTPAEKERAIELCRLQQKSLDDT